jgi:hypothetical protein
VHEVHPVAPVVAEYLPVMQAAHEVRPVLAAEVPIGQEVLYKQSNCVLTCILFRHIDYKKKRGRMSTIRA